MNSPLISIIVPVYNTEKYLDQCIQSVLAQTYTNWELLLINDGSTDSSGAICDKYAAEDNRIRVFHKENGGVSSARNLGLDNAKGEWITFVDSDDWVEDQYISRMIYYVNSNTDIIIISATIISSTLKHSHKVIPMIVNISNLDQAFELNDLHAMTAPWGKLFRRDKIEGHHLRFCLNVHIGEDAIFFFQYLKFVKTILISSDRLYNYLYEVPNSLTKQVNNHQSELAGYYLIKSSIDDLITVGQIHSIAATEKLGWMIGYYTRRVLNSAYHDLSIKFADRLSLLQQLDMRPYLDFVYKPILKEKVLALLLRYKLFLLYDLIRISVRRCKKNKFI